MAAKHDLFLDSLLQRESYTKLYSYTHLLNGFAIHTSEEAIEILRSARGVQAVHEDVKMEKLTTHTSDYLGIPSSVWPSLGGAPHAGEGVVIGMIDTGINPHHPSFSNERYSKRHRSNDNKLVNRVDKKGQACLNNGFNGTCETGRGFPRSVCGGKIAAARYFAHGVIANGDFNAARDYASPFDADGHGRQGQLKYMGLTLDFVLSISNTHAAATAAGNYRTPVMAGVYKALYSFGGYMSDVVAAVDQAVEDGVDILSLSIGPATVPAGPSAFLNVLDIELLFAVKAGVLVIQAVGNGGPSSSSVLSFSPWIISVAAADTDRNYADCLIYRSRTFNEAPTSRATHIPIASARDIIRRNSIDMLMKLEDCQRP
ncbi:Subtilisin-like protease SDD1 [Acorus calamus]|uniref:Subtilisin-like protease SDD1 n=1 Tax=Acorus calamus TaxID=4465 RepID=A0AAV9DZL2_ACOCL|nr:Subtilisin-like protease SDD1 [Acorus calamus]